MAQGPVFSVVDYAAWQKGYMPPAEHIVIDQLSYRGARVMAGVDYGERGWWLVVKGPVNRQAIRRVLLAMFEAMDEEPEPAATPEDGSQSPSASDGEGKSEGLMPTEPKDPDGLSSTSGRSALGSGG